MRKETFEECFERRRIRRFDVEQIAGRPGDAMHFAHARFTGEKRAEAGMSRRLHDALHVGVGPWAETVTIDPRAVAGDDAALLEPLHPAGGTRHAQVNLSAERAHGEAPVRFERGENHPIDIVHDVTNDTFVERGRCVSRSSAQGHLRYDGDTMSYPVRLTHIGGPTTLLEIGSLRILTDPTFDPAPGSYVVGPQILDKVGRIDVVVLSHDEHADNLDAQGRALLRRVPQVFTTVSGAGRLGGHVRGLAPWQSAVVTGSEGEHVRITATPGRHGPPGSEPLVGDVIGFLIAPEGPEQRAIYVSGDTVFYDDVAAIGTRAAVGLAILHLGNVRGPGDAQLTLDAHDAVQLAHTLGDPPVVPVHSEGWAHFSETPAAARAAFAADGFDAHVHWLEPGIARTFAVG